jgi:hypothetical protein
MKRFARFPAVLLALFLISVLLPTNAGAAGAFDTLNLETPPLVIEVGGPGLGEYPNDGITYTRKVNLKQGESGYLDYSVEGPIRATLSVEMVDLAIDIDGNKIPVPLNSTKFGLRNIVTPTLDKTTYIPNGKKQKYRVKLTNNVGNLKDIRIGGIKVNLIPAVDPKKGQKVINQVNAIVVTVGAVQYGFDLGKFNTQSKIKTYDHRFIPERRSGILGLIDLIPNIPRVITHGPAAWSIAIKNVGNQPIGEFVRWRIVKGFSAPYVDNTSKFKYYYAFEGTDHLTLPDQAFYEQTRTVILQNTEVQSNLRTYAAPKVTNALPMFGFITIDAQIHTFFGAFTGKTRHNTRTYLIFPWKEILVVILTYLAYRRIRRKIKEKRKERAERKLAEAEAAALEAMAALSPEHTARAKRSIAKNAAVKKAPVKKAPVKKAPVKKAPVKKAPVKKAPVKKARKN